MDKESAPYKVIDEDNDLLIIYKPAGLQVHPDSKNQGNTLTDFLVQKYPQIKEVGEAEERPGIVHRLDKDTSGIMMIVRNNEAFKYYKKQFQERKIQKNYQALVYGRVKAEEGKIELAIGRAYKNQAIRSTAPYAKDQKEALTYYKVLERYAEYTLCEARPKTGRTHQIRVHLKAIGHPICGDRIYKFKRLVAPEGLNTMFLISKRLAFKDRAGVNREYEIELDEELENVLENLRNI